MFAEIAFWVCLGLTAYVYAGYLLCVFVLAPIVRRQITKADIEPRLTVVIAAFNEEREIRETVMNKLSQDYPLDRLQVIVVSDGSTDRTDKIVLELVDHSEGRLRLLRLEPRQGKTEALNLALRHTSTDIVVFADANSIYAADALRMLVRSFADSSVGYVTGQMRYLNPGGSGIGSGSGTYMSYENMLRTLETQLGSVVGVDGGIDAVRRELYVPMRPDQLPDFALPLSVVEQGKRVVYEPNAVLYESALSHAEEELRMRVRVALRALWVLYDKRNLLNPFRFPMYSWQLLSHKILRYGAFVFLIGALAFNAIAAIGGHAFYRWFMALQLAVYACAALGHMLRRFPIKAAKLMAPYYFVILNVACALAFWKFLTGQRIVLWKPRAGT
jgi:cellulose synthase/poly-beta-1,6-N-acetylglucosamine synthase-like glycosyltransferase